MKISKVISRVFLLFLIVIPSLITLGHQNEPTISENSTDFNLKIKANPPFNITDNADFASYANGGGNGDEASPWIIQDYYIVASGESKHGIWITNTTNYFIIRNCTIVYTDSDKDGMRLENVLNGEIRNNTINHNGRHGLYITDSEKINITDNIFYNNSANTGRGIFLERTKNSLILCNYFEQNDYGIYLYQNCTSNLIQDNTIFNDTSYGCVLQWECDNNWLINNTAIKNAQRGIYLSDSNHNHIMNNSAIENSYEGIWIHSGSFNNTLTNNLVRDNHDTGIFILENNNSILNNRIYNNTNQGLRIVALDCVVIGNTIFNNSKNGLELQSSDSKIETNRIFANVENGIKVTYFGSHTFLNNHVYNNTEDGIFVEDSNNNEFFNNFIYNNSDDGISLINANNSQLRDNIIADNGDVGLYITSMGNEISYNLIDENGFFGIQVKGDYNYFYQNYIWKNHDSELYNQISDEGFNNIWIKNILGDKVDSDGDGISDYNEIINYGTDPYIFDSDNDFLSDGLELVYETNPLVNDTDGDGFLDGIEVVQGTDPLNPKSHPNAKNFMDWLIIILAIVSGIAIAFNIYLLLRVKKLEKKHAVASKPQLKE